MNEWSSSSWQFILLFMQSFVSSLKCLQELSRVALRKTSAERVTSFLPIRSQNRLVTSLGNSTTASQPFPLSNKPTN